jgi:hypothetical protein
VIYFIRGYFQFWVVLGLPKGEIPKLGLAKSRIPDHTKYWEMTPLRKIR